VRRILAGIETEYGLLVEGHGAEDQVDDSMALVRDYPGECHIGWDYRYESPRADLRGFKLERLAVDPVDAEFDSGRIYGEAHEVRADRVLPNGARFYNDHGHPEYATHECWSIFELAKHDRAGQIIVHRAAQAFSKQSNAEVRIYKNNTDFHGASYGTHEGYLVPRAIGFESLLQGLLPMMIVRQVLVGAGKVGSENSSAATYQLSQRADFFMDTANAETLYRRPIFNTRDEPHASPKEWIRLHVICGDANMIPSSTARKVGLMKLGIALCEIGAAPLWRIKDPVRAFQAISRDESLQFRIELEHRSWTTADEVFESYFSAAERLLDLDEELRWVIDSSRQLLSDLRTNFDRFRKEVDWAAKREMLTQFMEQEGVNWRDPRLRSFDLEYHNADPDESLHAALEQMGEVLPDPHLEDLLACLDGAGEHTRAFARGLAISRFNIHLLGVCWRTLTFDVEGSPCEIDLPPNAEYPAELAEATDVGTFIDMLRGVR
jgi:Pup amidohydrolase